jgi:hypothetical protein
MQCGRRRLNWKTVKDAAKCCRVWHRESLPDADTPRADERPDWLKAWLSSNKDATQHAGAVIDTATMRANERPDWLNAWLSSEGRQAERKEGVCCDCGKSPAIGNHAHCDGCLRPVCDSCAVQYRDGHYCYACDPRRRTSQARPSPMG